MRLLYEDSKTELQVLAILTFVLFIAKVFWTRFASGPVIFFDEMLYKENAEAIFNLSAYRHVLYPPFYSIAISPAFWMKNWYWGMLLLNAFWSSLTVPATWLLGRNAGLRHPLIAAFLVALIPYHVVFPRLVMSENIFVPLYVFGFALAMGGCKGTLRGAALFGAVIACSHLTKYLFLPSVLVFFICWILCSKKNHLEPHSLYRSALVALSVYFLIMGAWIYYGHESGFSTLRLLGLDLVKSRDSLKVEPDLVLWGGTYLSYVMLMALPVWGLAATWGAHLTSSSWRSRVDFNGWALLFWSLSLLGGYCIVSWNHSSHAPYNYPNPQYIIGRYLLHLTPLLLVLGAWFIEQLLANRSKINKKRSVLWLVLVSAAAVCSWEILFKDLIWDLPPWFAAIPHTAVDTFYLKYAILFIIFYTLSILQVCWIIFSKSKGYSNIIFFVFALSAISASSWYIINHNETQRHARAVSDAVFEMNVKDENVTICLDKKLPLNTIKNGFSFFHGFDDHYNFTVNDGAAKNIVQNGVNLYLTSQNIEGKPLKHYSVHNKEYTVYRLN